MFDTVTLLAFDIDIDPSLLNEVTPFTYIDSDSGSFISKFSFTKERIRFNYNLQKMILEIELSIPKLIYGTNTEMINELDINEFWIKLHNIIKENFNIKINKDEWKVKRIDVSYNFKVNNVESYINKINKKVISKRDKITYNDNETIIFKNKSSSICFYNKEKECIKKKESQQIIDQSKGLLRLEIRPATYHLSDYTNSKKAVDLITKAFFIYIINKLKINELLLFDNNLEENEIYKAIDAMKFADIEKVLGFKMLVELIGEKTLLENSYYKGGTFRNRKELIDNYNKIINQSDIRQKQLYINIG